VKESDSAAGQVLLIGKATMADGIAPPLTSVLHLVDLATGACAPMPNLHDQRNVSAAARLPDGRIICALGHPGQMSAEIYGPPETGALDAAWTWRELPALSNGRYGCRGCVMSDGRFAVLGGVSDGYTSSCEALVIDGDVHWETMPHVHDSRSTFACAAVAGCVIAAGGHNRKSAELYDESRGRWFRLPNDLPYENGLALMGSALL
jgi:hypothetical protein